LHITSLNEPLARYPSEDTPSRGTMIEDAAHYKRANSNARFHFHITAPEQAQLFGLMFEHLDAQDQVKKTRGPTSLEVPKLPRGGDVPGGAASVPEFSMAVDETVRVVVKGEIAGNQVEAHTDIYTVPAFSYPYIPPLLFVDAVYDVQIERIKAGTAP
jgi:hypothetical protein